MRNYANHGYVVHAKELANLFGDPLMADQWLEKIYKCKDEERLADWLEKHLPPGTTIPRLFRLTDECESMDLIIGELYADFEEADLFELVPTSYMKNLQDLGINPVISNWVTFG